MRRHIRWVFAAGIALQALGASAQERSGTFTTLPRPSPLAQLSGDAPAAPPPPAYGPVVPLPAPAPGPGPELIDPPAAYVPGETPFYRRVRADLVEAAILFPVIRQDWNAALNLGGAAVDARLPSAGLGVNAPFIANIQFDTANFGVFNLGYKMLSAEGNSLLLNFDPAGPAILRSRVDMNVVDLNFTRSGYGPLWNQLWFLHGDPVKPEWGLRWDVGVRVASVFMDTAAFGQTREQHLGSYFIGGGPHVGLTLHRLLGDTGLLLFARTDFGSNMGSVRQRYWEFDRDVAGNPVAFDYASSTSFRWVPTLTAEIGIGGEPPLTRRGRWQISYQFEDWFGVGGGNASGTDLMTHGLMFRWWWNY